MLKKGLGPYVIICHNRIGVLQESCEDNDALWTGVLGTKNGLGNIEYGAVGCHRTPGNSCKAGKA